MSGQANRCGRSADGNEADVSKSAPPQPTRRPAAPWEPLAFDVVTNRYLIPLEWWVDGLDGRDQ